MPSITCPKCNQSYNIDAASIGKQCECPCGHSFIAQANPPTPPVIPAKQVAASKPKRPRFASCGLAFCFRLLGYLSIISGIITMFGGLADDKGMIFLIGLGAVLSSLFYFAVSMVINTLLQIQENTRLIAEKYNNEAGQSFSGK